MLNRAEDVFASLHSHEVRYVVIGGIAAILHGVPRATFDLDILIEATHENAVRLLDALRDARLGTADMISQEQLLANEITIFNDRIRVDVQTRTPGLTFDAAWARREEMAYRGTPIPVASRADIILSKRASGRPVDLDDVRALENGDTSEEAG